MRLRLRSRGFLLPNKPLNNNQPLKTPEEVTLLLVQELQKIPADRLTNAELTQLTGLSERTLRRRKAALRNQYSPPATTTAPTTTTTAPIPNSNTELPPNAIQTRGKISRFTPGEGWDSVEYTIASEDDQKLLDYETDLLPLLDKFPLTAPKSSENDYFEQFSAADFQLGKALESGGGTPETVERVKNSLARFVERVQVSNPKAIVVTDLGDIIENMFNVPSHQLSTNDLDLVAQIRTARRLMLEVVLTLAPLAPELYYVAVPSNHGQVRTAPKSSVGGVDNDFGLDVSFQIEDVIAHSQVSNVTFVRPEPFQETAVLELCNTRVAYNHGHRTSGGQKGHDKWWAGQDHGRMPGWNADIFFFAHYHTFCIEQSGDGRWMISVSASEPSSDYFALANGKRSTRGVTCVRIGNGVWSDIEIL